MTAFLCWFRWPDRSLRCSLDRRRWLEDCGAPADLSMAGKSREDIQEMINAGIESGPATPMNAEDWQQLHARIDERSQASS